MITVLDAVMGSGKTTTLIEQMKEETRPILYIAPLLSECERISGLTINDNGTIEYDHNGCPVYQNNHPLAHKHFFTPTSKNKKGSKLESLRDLVECKRNIVSTHSLFAMLDKQLLESFERSGYVLIVDEALQVWKKFDLYSDWIESETEIGTISKSDKELTKLIDNGFIEVCPLGYCHWQSEKYDPSNTFHQRLAELCDLKQLVMVNGCACFVELSPSLLSAFKEIKIATYLFEGSMFSHYLKLHGFDYRVIKFGKSPSVFKGLIVIEEKWNDTINASYSSLVMRTGEIEKAKGVLRQFFETHKVGAASRLWTTYKARKGKIGGVRYSRQWQAFTTKATNEFSHCTHVSYLCNLHANTYLLGLIRKRGSDFDQDLYALSEMLQFLWRGCVRNGEVMTVHIPSKRMRTLLQRWLNDEFETCPLSEQIDDDSVGVDQQPLPEIIWDGVLQD
jgi:hypothetical protein